MQSPIEMKFEDRMQSPDPFSPMSSGPFRSDASEMTRSSSSKHQLSPTSPMSSGPFQSDISDITRSSSKHQISPTSPMSSGPFKTSTSDIYSPSSIRRSSSKHQPGYFEGILSPRSMRSRSFQVQPSQNSSNEDSDNSLNTNSTGGSTSPVRRDSNRHDSIKPGSPLTGRAELEVNKTKKNVSANSSASSIIIQKMSLHSDTASNSSLGSLHNIPRDKFKYPKSAPMTAENSMQSLQEVAAKSQSFDS